MTVESSPNSENPLVSVIMPSYNCRRWIGEALDSLLNQTYANLDIVVVDDGSTDDTATYLQENYAGKITYIYQPNGGLAHARNTGIRAAKGELISFLDADDWIVAEKIAHQVAYLKQHPECDIVYCNYWYAYDDNPTHLIIAEEFGFRIRAGEIMPLLLGGDNFPMHAPLLRRKCVERVKGFLESLRSLEDFDFWLRLAGAGFRFEYLDERLVIYRKRAGSLSRDLTNLRLHRYRAYAHIKEVLEPKQLHEALQKTEIAASFEFGLARAYFEKKDYRAGLRQVVAALRTPRRRRLLYSLFCLAYVALLPIFGYNRLERMISALITRLPKFKP
ncbi:MAG: glycosyltransferase [Chloroflexi bacterium]|nr:glycosyltransferase [Chloroflexota bacterium]